MYENKNAKIETMTLQELMLRMKALGMKTSKQTLADGIEQEKYPFAICIKRQGSVKRVFEIYTKLFDIWAEQRAVNY